MVERRIRTLLLLARMENSPHEAKELGLEDGSYVINDKSSIMGEYITISDAKRQCDQAIRQVEDIRKQLLYM